MFQELTEKAFVLQLDTKSLFVDLEFLSLREEQKREVIKESYSKFINSFYEFANVLGKSRAFIDLDIFDSYIEYSNMCQLQGNIFMMKIIGGLSLSKDELKDCKERREKIEQVNAATSLLIKTYLTKLKITKQ